MFLWRKRSNQKRIEGISAALAGRFGASLSIIERPGKAPIIEIVCARENEAMQLRREFGGVVKKLPAHWLREFTRKATSKPLRIGSRLLVSRTKGPNTIAIPAEAAFGTGDHATTAMCLRMLERVTRGLPPGWSILDAGTGSGILAIAGSRFGAGRIVAIDNDPLACTVARRNARANRAPTIEFRTGDVLKQNPRGKFDIITANLFSEILISGLPMWLAHLAGGGWLILSGVLRSQERSLLNALRRNSCEAVEIKRRGKWIAVLASRTRKRS
jgi:ribosomal protein L11 methyltransferase